MADYSNYNYVQLVTQAISDFDSIFRALVNRKVVGDSGVALTEANMNDGSVITSAYAGLITNQLFKVDGVTNGILENIDNTNVIPNYASKTQLGILDSLTYGVNGDNTVSNSLNVKLSNHGYYSKNSIINLSIPVQTISLSGSVSPSVGSTAQPHIEVGSSKITVKPYDNTILGKVQVDLGKLKAEINASNITTAIELKNSISINAEETEIDYKLELDTEDNPSDYVKLAVDASSSARGTISATPTVEFSQGYIDNSNASIQTTSTQIAYSSGDSSTAETKEVYIKKTTLGNIEGQGTIKLDHDIELDTSADETNGYRIAASLDTLSLTADVNKGYISENATLSGTAEIQNAVTYIKKGSIDESEIKLQNLEIENTDNIVLNATENAFNIKLNIPEGSNVFNVSVNPGYITDDVYSGTYSFASDQVLSIPKGSMEISNVIKDITISDENNIVTDVLGRDVEGYYELSTSASISSYINAKREGYFKNFTSEYVTLPEETSAEGGKYYIKKGSVSINHPVINTTPSNNTTNISVFLDSAPSSGEYYITKFNNSLNFTEGYIKESETTVSNVLTKYLPKAEVELTEGETGTFLNIKTAGYLESGILDIAGGGSGGDAGLTSASVTAVLNAGELIFGEGIYNEDLNDYENISDDDYVLSVTKNVPTAGYISSAQGELSLAKAYFIPHGKINASASITSVSMSTNPTVSSATEFVFTGTAKGNAYINLTKEGYVKASDITSTNIGDYSFEFKLPKAELSTTDSTIDLSATVQNVKYSNSVSTKYVFKPIIAENDLISLKVQQNGYITTDSYIDIAPKTSTATPTYYIQAGTGGVINETLLNNLTFANNGSLLSESTAGEKYTITVSGSANISGKISEGYYNGSDAYSNISGSAKIADGQTTSIAKGKVSSTASATLGIQSSSIVLHSADDVKGYESSYYLIKPTIDSSSFKNTANIVEGYVKSEDVALASTISTNSPNTYVAKYTTDVTVNPVDDSKSVYKPFTNGISGGATGTDVTVISIADKYSDKDIILTIDADATGSNVVTYINKLRNRLSGTSV